MNNDDVKSANRKAMPKFVLLTLISTIIGGAVGYLSAKYGLDTMAGSIKSAGSSSVRISPRGSWRQWRS